MRVTYPTAESVAAEREIYERDKREIRGEARHVSMLSGWRKERER